MCNNAVRALTTEKDVERAADCTRELIQDFPTVLREEFDSGPLKGRPMDIELRTDIKVVPRCATTTKPVPTHMEADAKVLIDELLKTGVIEPVPEGEVSEWISPGFFVPKPHGRGVRLVADYTQLNKFLKRPVHPFPTLSLIHI